MALQDRETAESVLNAVLKDLASRRVLNGIDHDVMQDELRPQLLKVIRKALTSPLSSPPQPVNLMAALRQGLELYAAPPQEPTGASPQAEPLRQHLLDRLALLTDCTPLDDKAATVLQARIDEIQQALMHPSLPAPVSPVEPTPEPPKWRYVGDGVFRSTCEEPETCEDDDDFEPPTVGNEVI